MASSSYTRRTWTNGVDTASASSLNDQDARIDEAFETLETEVARKSVREFWNAAHVDDTLSMEAAFAYVTTPATGTWIDNASGPDVGGPTLYFPSKAGGYNYNGTGMVDGGKGILAVEGDGAATTQIHVPDGVDLFTNPGFARHTDVKGLAFRGGRNTIRYTYTGTNVSYHHHVHDCIFVDYTGAAISHESPDMPYWNIKRNTFFARTDSNSMGVVIGGNSDGCVIDENNFQRNRVHVKLDDGGLNVYMRGNSFLRWDATRTAGPSIDLWIVPRTTSVSAGPGFVARDNKFGNENLASGDKMIVAADETGGTGRGDSFPNLAADSTGFVVGTNFTGNGYYGSSANPRSIIYSTTPNLRGPHVDGYDGMSGTGSYVYEFRTPSTVGDRLTEHATAGPFEGEAAASDTSPTRLKFSNAPGTGHFIDPSGAYSTYVDAPQAFPGGQSKAGWANLLPTSITAFTNQSSATKTSITDERGNADAAEITAAGGGAFGSLLQSASLTTANLVLGRPVYIEFEVARGTTAPVDIIGIALSTGTSPIHERRFVEVPATAGVWKPYRFKLDGLKNIGSTISVTIVQWAAVVGSVRIGQVRVYHAFEPVSFNNAIVRDTTGLTSAQIDALAGVMPFDGQHFIFDTTQNRLLFRMGGKWQWISGGTVIT